MHDSAEKPQERDGMRNYLLHIAQDNPINLDIIEDVGQFVTRKAAAAWAARQQASGELPEPIGTMKDANGRKVASVWCHTKYKDDNLRHQIMGTWFRLLYPAFRFEREPREHACFADMLMTDGEHTYEIEIDCGTMKHDRVKARWKKHKCEHDILIVVAPKTGDAENRLKQLLDWSKVLGQRAFVTTLERLKEHGPHAYVWDYLGRGNGPMKRVKLPVASAVESYMQDTPQMATGQGEEGADDDGN
jgi:hypothetical protein